MNFWSSFGFVGFWIWWLLYYRSPIGFYNRNGFTSGEVEPRKTLRACFKENSSLHISSAKPGFYHNFFKYSILTSQISQWPCLLLHKKPFITAQFHSIITAHFVHHCTLKQTLPPKVHVCCTVLYWTVLFLLYWLSPCSPTIGCLTASARMYFVCPLSVWLSPRLYGCLCRPICLFVCLSMCLQACLPYCLSASHSVPVKT